MVRLADLTATSRANLEALPCPSFDHRPWVQGPPLARRTVALISSAGLMLRGEPTVHRGEPGYRVIPHAVAASEVLMSHVSVNFDRTGYQQDLNVILPRERLDALAEAGEIGAAADEHYAFMGATDPAAMEPHARELAGRLHAAGVDSAVLLPV